MIYPNMARFPLAQCPNPLPPGAWGFRSYREYLAQRFPGQRVRKCCLQAGFTCPNLDGTVARGGCAYCDNRSFAPEAAGPDATGPLATWSDLRAQWARGRAALRRRHHHVDGFIAYFQAYSNTYADATTLAALYAPLPQALDECVGVSVGTRPDCLGAAVLDVLADLACRTFLTVEIGLQSDRDPVLRRLNRGHDVACFLDAVQRCAAHGLELCVHVMLGLPGEGDDAPERLGDLLATLPVASIKVHNLHVVRDTPWARAWADGRLVAPTSAWYITAIVRLVRRLRADQAVQRVVADAPRHLLLSEPWCRDKRAVLSAVATALAQPAEVA